MSALRRAPLAAWLAPEYPRVSTAQARALREGKSPRAIALEADPQSDLSSSEAHAWLSQEPLLSPLAWLSYRLAKQIGQPRLELRSWLVARWLDRVLRSPAERDALLRLRTIHGPAGAEIRVAFVSRLDEIQDCDLDRGISTGVQRAFERAAFRTTESRLRELERDHRVLCRPPAVRLGARARWLVTTAELIAEGRDMGHCVGGYSSAVERGQSLILAIRVRGARSTAEITPAGRVIQHKGPRNTTPDPRCTAVLRSVIRRMEHAK